MAPLRERMIAMNRWLGTRQLAALGAASVAVLAVVLIAVLLGGGTDKPAQSSAALGVSPTTTDAPTSQAAVHRHRPRRGRASRTRTRHAVHRRRVPRSPAAKPPKTRRPAGSPTKARATGGAVPATGSKHTSSKHVAAPTPTGANSVTFALKGGGDASVNACGATHHYRTYAAGSQVHFSGSVRPIPSGRWKVKLKIKVCAAGSFAQFAKFDALRDKHRGTFSGSFAAPPSGLYSVRAVLYVNGSSSADSLKHHFQTH